MHGLDFETFCEEDLPKRGLDNYITHPSFRPLIASVAYRDGMNIKVDRYDFVTRGDDVLSRLFHARVEGVTQFVAHNASFERAVLKRMHAKIGGHQVLDSAVIARAAGAGQKLEAAGPQLVDADKMADGRRLIMKFSVPQENGYVYVDHVEDWTQEDWDDWALFGDYCDLDAILSLQIAEQEGGLISSTEWKNEMVTQRMNDAGWFVDLDLVLRMQEQRDLNLSQLERNFRRRFDPNEELNFRSTPQLRKWCAERGIKATSFDELNVAKLLTKVKAAKDALDNVAVHTPQQAERYRNLIEVREMLRTKQELGGSSLSKLEKILDLVGPDGRLRGQYLHIGAGQTWRTSGRGAQMQNLKRLGQDIGDTTDVTDWDNGELARNLRQVFRAEHEFGRLVVGDFSSVESRGLAYLAGAEWKLDAYRQGKDMYKVLASSMIGIPYEQVTKPERQQGKVGELSCGYGAGPKAVKDFAEKMHHVIDLDQAEQIVNDWRDTNPEVVAFWAMLDEMLHEVVERRLATTRRRCGPTGDLIVEIRTTTTPRSLRRQRPDAQTIMLILRRRGSQDDIVSRVFQGVYLDGRDVCYHKPSELKGGKLWLEKWSKNGQTGRYKLYGGKLTGILVQSFCREIFFDSLRSLDTALDDVGNARIVGQFHDEIVVEWEPSAAPGDLPFPVLLSVMEQSMTQGNYPGFPLEADIKHDLRYIK